MKKFKSEELLNQLKKDVQHLISAAEHLKTVDSVKLSYVPEEGKWSVAQVIEHLNGYCRHYLPLMEKELVFISDQVNAWFTPGFWGNYFTNMIKPKNVYEIKNKMKTVKTFRPDRSVHVETAFNEFLEHQKKLLQLIDLAYKRDLNSIHIPITLTKMIRLKLGDMFRFLIAHEQRHMIQARNAVKAVGIATDKFPVILEAAQL